MLSQSCLDHHGPLMNDLVNTRGVIPLGGNGLDGARIEAAHDYPAEKADLSRIGGIDCCTWLKASEDST